MSLSLFPLTLKQANQLVANFHRHHKPVVGHRFSIGVKDEETIHGAAIVGRPVARAVPQYECAEITRLVSDGTSHVCSMLYAACARAAQAMGYKWIQTYILVTESGTSLRASGWHPIYTTGYDCDCKPGQHCSGCLTAGGDWNHGNRKGRRMDQPMCQKQRWGKRLF